MNIMKPDNYIQIKKLICDWMDKWKNLIHYKMLKFHVRHGLVVDKNHETVSFKQSKWLENNTQKRNKAKNDYQKDFYKLLKTFLYGKTMANVPNRVRLEFIRKDDTQKNIKQQSKLTFNGIHKSYENCDSCTFKKTKF